MDFVLTQTYLGDILHGIAQALLAPDVVLLLLFIGYSIWCVGSVIVEGVTERRNFKQASPAFLRALIDAQGEDAPRVVAESGLLNRQKIALLTVFDYRALPGDALLALTRKLVAREELRYSRIVGRNEMAVKAAPMLGLMGTLIPLGPGIAALGTGDIESLSRSIIVAFDTTVAGLATAFVCMAVVKVRKNWYEGYMTEFDSAMATMLQKIREMRAAGEITSDVPTHYAEDYASALKRSSAKQAEAARKTAESIEGSGSVASSEESSLPPVTTSEGAPDPSRKGGTIVDGVCSTMVPATESE